MLMTSQFGLPIFGARQVAQTGLVSTRLVTDIALSRSWLALASTAATILLLLLLPQVSRTELWLVGFLGLSNLVQAGFPDWIFQGLGRLGSSAALNVIFQGLWFLLTILGVHAGGGVEIVGLALFLAAMLATATGFMWLCHERLLKRETGPRSALWHEAWETLTFGAALGMGTLLLNMVVWTDAIWVRLLRGQVAMGVYAAGNRAALALSMLATFYVQGAFPVLSRTSGETRSAFEQCFERTYSDLAMLFVPGILWSVFYAKEIIGLVFRRPDYLAAVPVFQSFQFVLLLFLANTLLGTGVLVSFHRDRAFRKVLFGTAVIFLVLCPLFTWRWGICGAAAAMLVAQATCFLSLYHEARKLVRPHYTRTLLFPLVAGTSAVVVCRILDLSLSASLAPITLVYLVLLALRSRN
jgi:O-antigen/teichoic acid export membrane protein